MIAKTRTGRQQRGPSFKSVWMMSAKSKAEHDRMDAKHKEMVAEFDRMDAKHKEMGADFDRRMEKLEKSQEKLEKSQEKLEKSQEKTDRQIDRLSKNMGGLSQTVGALVETLMVGRLWEKFPQYEFDNASRRIEIVGENNRCVTEIDILLLNTEWVMAVEVKSDPSIKDVDHHLKRMDIIRKYNISQVRGKKLLGAIAGAAVPDDVRDYAHRCGFYVLELNGDNVKLLKSPEGFAVLMK
jgi:seryl-tRNA synthetase